MMGCNRHVISMGIHIPKAKEVRSDQGFGCDFRCGWERPLGPGWVWLELTQVGWGALGGDDGVNPEETRWG